MPGPTPKPSGRRQRRNKPGMAGAQGRVLQLRPARVPAEVPAPAPKWLPETQQQWGTFWQSEIGRLVEANTDQPALRRLFSLYDERERAYRSYQRHRLVKGSQGQPVLNPLWASAAKMDTEIRALEDRFGMTPQSRLKLGITFGEAAKTLEQLNKEINDDRGETSDAADETDPRLRLIGRR